MTGETSPPKDDELREPLARLVQSSGAITALLITKEGIALAEAGETSYFNTAAMAALVAGMFSATREVARMVGEQQFSILLQQGENRHIHISLVTDVVMLVVIFEDYLRIGRVRLEARKSSHGLAHVLASGADSARARGEISEGAFKEGAITLINRIFCTE